MTEGRIQKACDSCRGFSYNGTFTCDDCRKKSQERQKAENPVVTKLRRTADWKVRTRPTMLAFNPFCQRVNDWVRCRNQATIIHHVIPAEKLASVGRFFDAKFLVAVCDSCHPRPKDFDQGVYIPTVWLDFMSEDPVPEALGQPGLKLTAEQMGKLWSLPERVAFIKTLLAQAN
jgi:hypothetical protein